MTKSQRFGLVVMIMAATFLLMSEITDGPKVVLFACSALMGFGALVFINSK